VNKVNKSNPTSVGYAEALGNGNKPRKAAPKEIRSIEVEKAENGGTTVTHRFQHQSEGPYHESETHVFGASENKKLMSHLSEHLGIKTESPDEELAHPGNDE
jgi:hypothetical protein